MNYALTIKGKSRSKRLSFDDDESSGSKKTKINKEFRTARIKELEDQIKDMSEQVQYKELRRDSARSVHNYRECDNLTEQLSVLNTDKRRLVLERLALTRKQKMAEWYQAKKRTLQRHSPFQHLSSSPEPRSSSSGFSTPLTSAFHHSFTSSPSPSPSPSPSHTQIPPRFLTPSPTYPFPLPHYSFNLLPANALLPVYVSDDTVELSSDEANSELASTANPFPPLRRQNTVVVNPNGSLTDNIPSTSSQSCDNSPSSLDQHYQ